MNNITTTTTVDAPSYRHDVSTVSTVDPSASPSTRLPANYTGINGATTPGCIYYCLACGAASADECVCDDLNFDEYDPNDKDTDNGYAGHCSTCTCPNC